MTVNDLKEKYPALFAECREVSIEQGWLPIMGALCAMLQCLGSPSLAQVKEKFGGLRIYFTGVGPSDAARGAVRMAELVAATTCERCGTNQDVTTESSGTSWIKTLCYACHTERNRLWMQRTSP